MGPEGSRSFPLKFFVRFFTNHGLLNIADRPQWYSIVGGSRSYIPALTAPYKESIRLATPVRKLVREAAGIRLISAEKTELFDEIVLACHADQALALLDQPSPEEHTVLQAIPFTENQVVLHFDDTVLPHRKRAWASWNYQITDSEVQQPTLTYNMNILQRLEKKHTYLVSLNREVPEDRVLNRFVYSHPVYTNATLEAQQQWHSISGCDRVHYCGAYWFNGFHEDGVRSALRVCESLGVTP